MKEELSNIVYFLPYEEKLILNKFPEKIHVLKMLSSIIIHAKMAAEEILQKKYEKFDAHVGDTCCQVRASYLLFIANQLKIKDIYFKFKKELKDIIAFYQKLSNVIEDFETKYRNRSSHYDEFLDKKESIEKFMKNFDINFSFSKEMSFLLSAFILFIYSQRSEEDTPSSINFEKMKNSWNISTTTARKISKILQKKLSIISCSFLEFLLRSYSNNFFEKKIISLLTIEADEGRLVFPCFEGMRLILKNMQKNNQITILIINRSFFLEEENILFGFYFDQTEDKEVVIKNINSFSDNIPVMAIYGVCQAEQYETPDNYIKKMKKHGIHEILLANMAKHPQFPGMKLEHLKVNPYRTLSNTNNDEPGFWDTLMELEGMYKKMYDYATNIGAYRENPSLFYIKHVFCTTTTYIKSSPFRKKTVLLRNKIVLSA